MTTQDTTVLRARATAGAHWFYWIAALSVVNSVVAATGSTWGFMAGLGVTQLIDGLGQAIGTWSKPITLVLDGMVASVFVALGWWAGRKTAIYVTGMVLFALDSIVFALVGDWLGLGFHGLVLFFLWNGLSAKFALDRATATPGTGDATMPDSEERAA
jgi:hypothetical protein